MYGDDLASRDWSDEGHKVRLKCGLWVCYQSGRFSAVHTQHCNTVQEHFDVTAVSAAISADMFVPDQWLPLRLQTAVLI